MKKKIIVINGMHGSGKSTLARMLAKRQRRNFQYFDELGKRLRHEVDYDVLNSGKDFDHEVLQRELTRDKKVFDSDKTPIIETWHIGNIAFLLNRSPQLCNAAEKVLLKQLKKFDPLLIMLDIDRNTFFKRATEEIEPGREEDLYQFYFRIRDSILKLCDKFGLKFVIIENKEGLLEKTYQRLLANIEEFCF